MSKSILIFVFVSISLFSIAQESNFEDTQLYYNKEYSGGIIGHTTGFGANFRYTKRITGFKRVLFTADFNTFKHPKEKKIESTLKNYRGYVLGKINSFSALKPSVGYEKIIFRKDAKNGVQIAYNFQIGPSIGILKPVYLDIGYPTINEHKGTPSTERYDPEKHTQDKIFGRAHFMKGMDKLNFLLGAQGKIGVTFEYSADDELVRQIETGLMLDAYPKPVEIMAYTSNKQFFLNYYIAINLGKKFLE